MTTPIRLLLLLTLLWPCAAQGQILNTLRGFGDSEMGWSGSVEARFSLTGGNTEVLLVTGGGKAQWQGEHHRWRLIGGATRGTSRGETFAENTVAHLRHNYRVSEWISSLAFLQHQSSLFQRLRSRLLLGFGARLDLVRREEWGLSVGLSPMLELENIKDQENNQDDLRLSSFLVIQGNLSESASIDLTSFIQPRPGDVEDVRAIASSTLRVDLGGGFSLVNTANYQYDADPPAGVEKTDWDLASGFGYRF